MRHQTILGLALGIFVALSINNANAEHRISAIYKFKDRANGAFPNGPLIVGTDGALYGTTAEGGAPCNCGSVFKITTGGVLTVLHKFTGGDGSSPQAALVEDASGNLYGTTAGGGGGQGVGSGVVFKVMPDGNESTLYAFQGGSDGAGPQSTPLVMDSSGNLYGTTWSGGAVYQGGVVFKVAQDGTETVLHSFNTHSLPQGPLVIDKGGNIYGTTFNGGNTNPICSNEGNTCGTVFKIAPDGTTTTLYAFCSESGCRDGAQPESGLFAGSDGSLYGTATGGGSGAYCPAQYCGVVFKLTLDGTETVLHSFCSKQNCRDGSLPISYGSLIADTKGNLYGTTVQGGLYNRGTVFSLSPQKSERVLHSFRLKQDSLVQGGVVADAGFLHLYSVAGGFGKHNTGAVYVTVP